MTRHIVYTTRHLVYFSTRYQEYFPTRAYHTTTSLVYYNTRYLSYHCLDPYYTTRNLPYLGNQWLSVYLRSCRNCQRLEFYTRLLSGISSAPQANSRLTAGQPQLGSIKRKVATALARYELIDTDSRIRYVQSADVDGHILHSNARK